MMLILMGMVLVCLVVDEYGDAQHRSKHIATSNCLTAVAGDFDVDDDDDGDELVTKFCVDNDGCSAAPMPVDNVQKMMESKRPLALQRGQVRRYSPRNDLLCSNNYVLFENYKSSVDLFRATFFVLFTQLLNFKHLQQ